MRSIACSLAFAALTTAAISASAQSAPAPLRPPSAPNTRPPWGVAPYAMWALPPPAPLPATERRSPALAITGIGVWAAGIATSGAGVGLVVNAAANPCVNFALEGGVARPVAFSSSSFARGERVGQARQAFGMCDDTGSIGAVLIVVGAVVGLVGIPLFVVGNRQVPVKPDMIPEARPGLGGGELRWVF